MKASAADAARTRRSANVGHSTGSEAVGAGAASGSATSVSYARKGPWPEPGVDSGHARAPSRPERPRLSRQRPAHADRQVRRCPADDAGGRARRGRDPGGGQRPRTCPMATPIDEVLMGQVLQAGVGQAPARQAALRAGLPVTTSATTINRVCGSGLKAIMLAAAEIRAGDAEVAVAGGMESMNGAPYLLPGARFGYRLGNAELDGRDRPRRAVVRDRGLSHGHPRRTRRRPSDHVSRDDQDAFALESHRRAIAAIDAGRFEAEIAPVTVRDAKGRETTISIDEGPSARHDRRGPGPPPSGLRPARRRGPGEPTRRPPSPPATPPGSPMGRPRPSSPASARSSESASSRWPGSSATPRPRSSRSGCSWPRSPGVRRLLERIELPIEAFDLIEINEAFAAQVLADGRELGFDWDKVNVNGGAIALGHPIGASGARIVATLLHELQRRRAATDSPRCASGAAAPWRWPSSGCEMTDTASPDLAAPDGAPTFRRFHRRRMGRERLRSDVREPQPGGYPGRDRPLPAGTTRRMSRRPSGRPRPPTGLAGARRRRSAARSCTASARSWPSTRSASPAR